MVQIFAEQKGIIFIALHQDVFCILRNEHGERKTEYNEDDKAC